MSLTADQITAKNFEEYHKRILPYLNGSFPTPIVNKFSKGDLYSTEEKIIGQWIDGKPLYQKTIDCGNLPSSGEKVVATLDSNINFVLPVCGVIYTSTADTFRPFPFLWNSQAAQIGYNIEKSGSNLVVKVIVNYDRSGEKAYIILKYTKSTDSPISIGDGNDYSTDEQVVGTWIDGKPLYQKTIVSNSYWDISANSWASTGVSMSNIGMVINAIGIRDKRTLPIGARMNNDVVEIISYRTTGDEIDTVTIQYTKTTD